LLRFNADKAGEECIHQQNAQHAQLIQDMIQAFEDELRIAIDDGFANPLPGGCSPSGLLLGLFHGLLQN